MKKWTNQNPYVAPPRLTNDYLRTLYASIGVDIDGLSEPQRCVLRTDASTVFVAGGVRAGKSFCCALKCFTQIVADMGSHRIEPGAEYWLVGNNYKNTQREYFHLKTWLGMLGWVQFASKTCEEATIELSICPFEECANSRALRGTKCQHVKQSPVVIKTISSDNEDNIASVAVEMLLACEGAQMSQTAYERCEERCAEKGAQLIISGTMDRMGSWYVEAIEKALDPEYQLENDVFGISIDSLDNTYAFPGGEDDPDYIRLTKRMKKSTMELRVRGQVRPAEQVIFGKEFNKDVHIAKKELEVDIFNTVWLTHDPSYNRPGALLVCQLHEHQNYKTLKVIDEIYTTQKKTSEVIDMVRRKEWYEFAKHKQVTGDPAMTQHSHNDSDKELWELHTGLNVILPKPSRVKVQIEWMRELLRVIPGQRPYLLISPRCKGLLSEFGHGPSPITGYAAPYEYKYEKNTNDLTDEPIDKNNHSIKALTYLLFVLEWAGGRTELLREESSKPKRNRWMKRHRSPYNGHY